MEPNILRWVTLRSTQPTIILNTKRIELYCISDLADLANKQKLAEEIFATNLPRVETVIQKLV